MTLHEYPDRLIELEKVAERAADAVFVPAANELLATIKNRIRVDGKNSAGGSIGNYSTTPAYYSQPQFIRKSSFKPQGKTGKTKHANGEPHKTMYLPSGYTQLRDIQGRETGKMNLDYSGSTLNSYQMQTDKDAILLGLTNQEAAKVRQGQEKKRGRIFYATEQEMNTYNDNIRDGLAEITKRVMNA